MNKILKVFFTIVCMFLLSTNLKAYTLTKEKSIWVENGWGNLKDAYNVNEWSTIGWIEHVNLFYMDGVVAYCIEPGHTLTTTDYIKSYNNPEVWKKLELISYYGYGYPEHDSIEWRVATQLLIWRTIKPEFRIEVDTFASETTNPVITSYMNEINSMIKKHSLKPSFEKENIILGINNSLELTDSNYVLQEYEIVESDLEAQIKENKLILFSESSGIKTIKLRRKNYTNITSQLYIGNNADTQNIATLNASDLNDFEIKVDIVQGKITLQRECINNCTDVNHSNSEYSIYDKDNNLVNSFKTDANGYGEYLFNTFKEGTYYIKELNPSIGFQKDDKTYEVNISLDNPSPMITTENIAVKSLVEVNTDKINTTFEILNANDEVTHTVTTNDLGTFSLNLCYGNYTLREINNNKTKEIIVTNSEPQKIEFKETQLINISNLPNAGNNNYIIILSLIIIFISIGVLIYAKKKI